ncbi:MAG: hypothetical protein M5R36_12670 [Deltaproteobacteria bacterium]|nr:hypothetical protein [Deltaproteobacteria bacterium]
MFGSLLVAALFVGALVLWTTSRLYWRRGRKGPLGRVLDGETPRSGLILSLPLAFAAFMGLGAAFLLAFVAAVCFFYAGGLAVGEIGFVFGVLDPTAGNLLVSVTFPAQLFLLGLFLLLLVAGSFQLFAGPLPERYFRFIRIDDLRALAAKSALLLSLVAALEVVRVLAAASILPPERWTAFFARPDQMPLWDPTGMALLAAATLLGGVVVYLWGRKAP